MFRILLCERVVLANTNQHASQASFAFDLADEPEEDLVEAAVKLIIEDGDPHLSRV